MQLNRGSKGNRAVVGDSRSGDRRAVHLFALASVSAGQDAAQVPQLPTRVQIDLQSGRKQFASSPLAYRVSNVGIEFNLR